MMLALNVNNNMAQVPQESASKPRPFYGGNESQMPGTVRRLHCLNPVEPLTETIQVYPSWTLNTFTKAATTSLWTMATCHGDAALLSWTFSTFGELGTGRRNLSVRSTNSLGLCTSMCILNHLYPCYPKLPSSASPPCSVSQVSPPPFSGFHLRRCPQPTWQFHQRFHDKALPPRDSPPDAK